MLARAHRRLARRPHVPRLAREVADQVHGRRLSAPRAMRAARRGAARPRARGLRRCPPPPSAPPTTSASTRRSQDGPRLRRRARPPRPVSGEQMIARRATWPSARRRRPRHAPAELRARDVPEERVDEAVAELEPIGFPLDLNPRPRRARSPAPASRTATSRSRRRRRGSDALIQALEARFGDADRGPAAAPRRLPARLRAALGRRPRLPGHDRPRRGRRSAARPTTSSCAAGSAPAPRSARPLFRRVPTEELDDAVDGLVGGWLDARATDESFRAFCDRIDRRRARGPRARAALEDRPRGATRMREREEAGSVSVRAHRRAGGRRARRSSSRARSREALLEWALERFSPRIAHLDRVPDRRRRAHRHGLRDRPERAGLLGRHRPPAGRRRSS